MQKQAEMLKLARMFQIPSNFVPIHTPDCVKILISEMVSLGEAMIGDAIGKYSVLGDDEDGKECYMIELDELIKVIALFKYRFLSGDRNDLLSYLFNNSLIATSKVLPKKDKIYINVGNLMTSMKKDLKTLGLTLPEASHTHGDITLSQSF